MNAQQLLAELAPLGKESYKRLLIKNYGVKEPLFGVAVSELKKFQKRHKDDHQLALDLYDTGNYDAMYLAGLIADDSKMSRKDLDRWAAKATNASMPMMVSWVASGNRHAWPAALDWIESPKPHVASVGWFTLASYVGRTVDSELDLPALKKLLHRVQTEIHKAPDMVRYAMNAFVIALGGHVKPLHPDALAAAEKIGQVTANLGDNNCKIPKAADYIRKIEARKGIGKKLSSVKC